MYYNGDVQTVDCAAGIQDLAIRRDLLSQLKFISYDQKYFYILTFQLPTEVFFIRRMKTSFLHRFLAQ